MNRRDFLLYSGLLPFAGSLPTLATARPHQQKILVLLELAGGNDGLNTLIPYTDSAYYAARPHLAIPKEQVIPINQKVGIHPSLKPLLSHWNKKQLAWIQGVGYPHASRSHFRSINIWETALTSGKKSHKGWVDQYASARQNKIDGIILDGNAGPLTGQHLKTLTIDNPETFLQQAKLIQTRRKTTNNQALAYVLQQQQQLNSASSMIANKLQHRQKITTPFPKHKFGQQMKNAAQLIASNIDVPIYKVGLGGFDTHTHQKTQHSSLLNKLSTGLASFSQAMKQLGLWDNVLIMSYSEFGRRVAENGSGGTDHGAASVHFAMGGKVQGGLYGRQPSLEDLDNGDLKYNVDFRSLYATIDNHWLRQASQTVAGFKPLGFV